MLAASKKSSTNHANSVANMLERPRLRASSRRFKLLLVKVLPDGALAPGAEPDAKNKGGNTPSFRWSTARHFLFQIRAIPPAKPGSTSGKRMVGNLTLLKILSQPKFSMVVPEPPGLLETGIIVDPPFEYPYGIISTGIWTCDRRFSPRTGRATKFCDLFQLQSRCSSDKGWVPTYALVKGKPVKTPLPIELPSPNSEGFGVSPMAPMNNHQNFLHT